MRLLTLLVLFCCLPVLFFAQSSQWRNYAKADLINHIAFEKNYAWLSTRTGLWRLDPATGVTKIFQPWNSGLHGMHVHEALADAQGTKWVAGEYGGLFRYDDVNWQSFFYAANGDSLLQVRRLRANGAGQLWFFSRRNNQSGYKACYHFDGAAVQEVINPSAKYPITDIAVDQQGTLWASAGYELYRFDDPAAPQLVYDSLSGPLVPGESVTYMAFDPAGRLYLSTVRYSYSGGSSIQNCRLLRYDGTEWRTLGPLQTGLAIGYVRQMVTDDAGNFWIVFNENIGGSQVLLKTDGQNWTAIKMSSLNVPAGNGLYQTTVAPSGHIWTEISGYPVAEYDWNSWKGHPIALDPLPSNSINDVAFDDQQHIWFGGSNTLTRFDGQNWKSFSGAEIGLSTSGFNIWSLNNDPSDGSLWMAFYDNNSDPVGFARYDALEGFSTFQTPSGYDAFEVLPLPAGRRWVVATNALGYFDGAGWTWYNFNNGPFLQFEGFLDAAIDPTGGLWSILLHDSIAHFDGANWTIFDSSNMPLKASGTWVMADAAGHIFSSNSTNLLRYDGFNWQVIPVPGLPANAYLNAMTQDADQSYWIASNYGVFHWDGTSVWTHYHSENSALGENLTYEIRIDPLGNKWFMHNSVGITVFNPNGIAGPIVGLKPNLPEDFSAPEWRLFPNPSTGKFWVEGLNRSEASIYVFDALGRPVRPLLANGTALSVEGLAAGLYFVCPQGVGCRKLIVLR